MIKKYLLLSVFILIVTVGTGAKKKEYAVGVTLLTRDVFYQELEKGMQEGAKGRGIKLRIQSAEKDLNLQTTQVENFVVQGVDALVVCPVDSTGIGSAIERAAKAGIPVFTADIRAQEARVICHIASDNRQGGRLAGEYLAKLLGYEGEVAIIDHPEVTSVQERVAGFKEAVSRYPGMKIVDEPSAGGDRDRAMIITQNMLLAHPRLRGIFAINDNTALGAMAALEAAGKREVFIVGYDATPEAKQAIRKGGPLKADVIQYPGTIGRVTIGTVAVFLEGQTVPLEIPIETGIVDKESLSRE
ncbi:MAG: substrate-binding domain-containing protein [Candidatus Brocadiaceae bacterium]|nr:substrate-binding domain-containing protein [Candidatus Brocadiaceae bacterium]